MMKSGIPQSGMILFVMVAFVLSACSVLASATSASPEPTINPSNSPQPPTEITPLVQATNTPTAPSPISLSNFQNLVSLYQWNLGSDIVKITGAVLSPLADKAALLTVRYPKQYSLELRESETGNLLWTQSLGTKAAYSALAFSANESLVAVGLGSGKVLLWNVSDGRLSKTLQGASYAVRAVAFSPDGSLIAASGSDSMVHVWQVSDGEARAPYVLKNNVGNLVFSPDGRYLATASEVFAVYDLSSGTNVPVLYYDPGTPHATSEIIFSPDGRSLIAEGELNDVNHNVWIPRVLIWELSSNRPASRRITLTDPIQNMVVLPDGQSILGYDASKGQLDLIDISNKVIAGTVNLGTIFFMDYSADFSRFMVVMKTSVAIWGIPQ
ncbi:MAG: hypothetical protein M1485_01710 [Chloroflexi bacterium]|nr:hypothetical protein [Chloroflexota bacterium]